MSHETVRTGSMEVAAIASSRTNPVWEAFSSIFGEPPNRAQQERRGKNVRDVTEALAGEMPYDEDVSGAEAFEEVVHRAQQWPLHFDGATLTEEALARHFTALSRPPLKAPKGGEGVRSMTDWKTEPDVSDRWPKFTDFVFVLPDGDGEVGFAGFVEWLATWRPERLTVTVPEEGEIDGRCDCGSDHCPRCGEGNVW